MASSCTSSAGLRFAPRMPLPHVSWECGYREGSQERGRTYVVADLLTPSSAGSVLSLQLLFIPPPASLGFCDSWVRCVCVRSAP